MRQAFILLVSWLAATASAAFDPTLFPMWLNPAKTDAVESNVVAETRARQLSMWQASNVLVNVSFWRSRSGNLQAIKDKYDAMLDSGRWVMIDEIAGDVVGTLRASNSVPCYHATNKLAALSAWQLPTNCLDYTPWRDLAGVGGFTNDLAAVGRPHGVTNAVTARGGTNFPSGRTCWYTTDYGWDVVKTVGEHLTALKFDYDQNEVIGTHVPYWGWCGSGTEPTYAETIARAQGPNWSQSSDFGFQGIGQYTWARVYHSMDLIAVRTSTHSGRATYTLGLNPAATGWVDSCRFYFEVTNSWYQIESEFDAQSYAWSFGWNEASGVLTNAKPTYSFTVTNPPPNWVDLPTTNLQGALGWNLMNNVVVPLIVRFAY